VHVGDARLKTRRLFVARAGYAFGLALLIFLFGSRALQNAVAEGDTRTITMRHIHTGEDITITYKRDGRYDDAALAKLNWFLRDWRRGEQTNMDPRLVDLVWEVQRESGSKEPIQVVCGYRSPQTNAMLRRSSEGVARFSQHILGRAMDFYVPGIPLEQLREIGLRLARGGVGFYPESGSPFVHMDVAGIRMWPRMTREQLSRVFPDGRTVQIPTDGKPMPGYALALADARDNGTMPSENSLTAARAAGIDVGSMVASNDPPAANPFARLLGLSKPAKDEDDEDADATPAAAPDGSQPVAVAVANPTPASAPGKLARAIDKLKLVHVAKLLPAPAAPANAAATAASPTTPDQIIAARGYWQGPPDGTSDGASAANPLTAVSYRVAEADPDSTGSVAADGHAGSGLALGFADQSADSGSAATPTGIAALRAAAVAAKDIPADTSVAVKRTADQVASAVMTASASSITVIKSGAHFANPWLRAIVLSPSVQRFLTTLALGDRDMRSLASLMIKPHNAVKMTFAADPNPGLSGDHFTGAAIVFVSTVNYPTRTASLQ
jgi:uncharacterized protein YcbK (DUF882 family)